jgi:hypothetical protein
VQRLDILCDHADPKWALARAEYLMIGTRRELGFVLNPPELKVIRPERDKPIAQARRMTHRLLVRHKPLCDIFGEIVINIRSAGKGHDVIEPNGCHLSLRVRGNSRPEKPASVVLAGISAFG